MTAPLPLLTEDDVRSVVAPDEERSFGCLRSPQGVLPLAALHVSGRIIGTFAHTTLTQTFVNNTGVPVEATYVFPLPDRAAVTRFVMEVAGRRVEGDLQERSQARQTYDRAIAQGKRASIAEEERPGTFTLRVGNLMPGERAQIMFEMTGPLPVADGEVTYRFPLVVAPRYMPGRALDGEQVGDGTARDTNAVPDASRISPPVLLAGYPNPVALSIDVSLDAAGLPISQVRSALHAAWADESQGLLRVHVSPGERVNRDFILRFRLGDAAVRTSARATRKNDGHDDAFLLTLLPPASSTSTTRPRDLVFVLDRSGSMGGWKMIAARRAVARMVDTLRPSDRFSVLAFDDRVEAFAHGLTEATDRNRFRAVEWLAKVDARGGTEMAMPLQSATELLGGAPGAVLLGRDRVLVFVTDGQVGNEAQLMKLLGQRLKGTRVFALGIDQAVNAGFLNRLAALGGQGDAELVESEDRVDEVLTRCHRRIDVPVVSDVSVDVEGAVLVGGSIAPTRLPDLFVGVPAVIAGRLRRTGTQKPALVVRGKRADGSAFVDRVDVDVSGNPALMPAWARLHLRDLEDRFDGGKENKSELERRIVQVSLEAKVMCRFTSFVAVDHEVVNAGGRLHKAQQPVEMPAGWEGAADKSSVSSVSSARRSAPAPRAAPAPTGMPRTKAMAVDDDDSLFALDAGPLDDLESVAEFEAAPVAASPARSRVQAASAPPPPAAAGGPGGGGFLGRMAEAAKDAFGRSAEREEEKAERPAKKKAMPAGADLAPPKAPAPSPTTTLAHFADRLRVLIERLNAGDAIDDVVTELDLILEEVAHAGITPEARKPIVDALFALRQGDRDRAVALLTPLAGPAKRAGFWR
jgi:Ca-activated chloride channel family protein